VIGDATALWGAEFSARLQDRCGNEGDGDAIRRDAIRQFLGLEIGEAMDHDPPAGLLFSKLDPPEQPVEPAPPYRWRAFTDDELEALWWWLPSPASVETRAAQGTDVRAAALCGEIEAEQQLRRVPQ
jgi:hypothetical protein